MDTSRYLIVGGGMTGDAACAGIREHDSEGSIILVGTESHPPYKRPPLTKGLWGKGEESSIWRKTDERGVDLRLGRTIVDLNVARRVATDDRGDTYEYERVLLATGGHPRQLQDSNAEVVYFRTLDDYRLLRGKADVGARFVVIGGGFIGSEIAASLASNGCQVTMVFPEAAIAARLLPPALAAAVTETYRSHGVEVLAGDSVLELTLSDGHTVVGTGSGAHIATDVVVAGLGIEPNVALAEAADLPVDGGIIVDEYGRVGGRNDVFAAGDVAVFPFPVLGGLRRVEHEDHANSHGRLVGANMAGAHEVYDHMPFFYSDMFDLGYEAVGDLDTRLTLVESWAEPNRKGIVAYTDDASRARGMLMWGVYGKVDAAREIIRSKAAVDKDLLGGLL